MHAAILAGVSFDHRIWIHYRQLVVICSHLELVTRYDSDLGEQSPSGFPALGAPANVIMGALAGNRYRDFPFRTAAEERAAWEVCRRGFRALINRWMYGNRFGHGPFLLVCDLPTKCLRDLQRMPEDAPGRAKRSIRQAAYVLQGCRRWRPSTLQKLPALEIMLTERAARE
jgi:hypothetical protein